MISARGVMAVTLFTASLATLAVAALGLISGLLFRGGLMLMLFGIAVATPRGEAGRLRAFGRALIAWSPAALALLAVLRESGPTRIGWMPFAAVSFTVFAIGLVFAIRSPERGLQDRLAGTWLVPRRCLKGSGERCQEVGSIQPDSEQRAPNLEPRTTYRAPRIADSGHSGISYNRN